MNKEEQLKVSGSLVVFFEEPFWVGVFERICEGKLSVCKVTFGPEPKDYEIQDFILKNYDRLIFSQAIDSDQVVKKCMNPKRLQRKVKRQLLDVGIGTKSQQALKLQYEQRKEERKSESRQKREEEQQHLFNLRQEKKREKHRGR